MQANCPFPPPRALAGITCPTSTSTQHADSSQSKRARKDRGPNWSSQEVLALINAKHEMFLEDIDTIDGRDLMTPENTKWNRISDEVMKVGYSPCIRDGPACKTKWNQLLLDYKRIVDYLSRTGRNVPDYWDLSSDERRAEGLPKQFSQDFFIAIHDWYGNRPQMRPPHVRNLLSPNDGNYQPHAALEDQGPEDQSEPETKDLMDMQMRHIQEASAETTPPQSPPVLSSTPSRTPAASISDGTPNHNTKAFQGLPPGISPQVISS